MKNLISALIKAQKEMSFAIKDSKNTYFKSKYADFSSVWATVKDSLHNNGLCISQTTTTDGFLKTILMHESGELLESFTPIIVSKIHDPQAYGSALTYARRYALSAIICAATEDDDAEAAVGREVKKQEEKVVIPIKKTAVIQQKAPSFKLENEEEELEKKRIRKEIELYYNNKTRDKSPEEKEKIFYSLGFKKGDKLGTMDIDQLDMIHAKVEEDRNKERSEEKITTESLPF
jgi:hypothetical protein